jgi:hypothetical protein
MNYSANPKYIFISGDAVFFSKRKVTQNISCLDEPRTNSLYMWLKLGRSAVLLALFDIMITAVNTVMYEV